MDPELCSPNARPKRKHKNASYAEIDEEEMIRGNQSPSKKAKRIVKSAEVVDLTVDSPKKGSPKKKGKKTSDEPVKEKRLRRFRSAAPQSYVAIKERALTQRLTVLSRERCGTEEVPEEKVTMAGSTGNIYTQNVALVPGCDCPHANKGNQCKHIIYVMLRVLKAPEHLAYQLALTTAELREVIKNAPAIPGVETDPTDAAGEQDGNRKPIEGECPICYDELDASKDSIVYCKSACGNNVHKDCMQKWISMSGGGKATCPYCRAKWDTAEDFDSKLGSIDTKGLQRNDDGYVNVAGQLGLSGERDYSTYHPFWARQQGYGRRRDRDFDYD